MDEEILAHIKQRVEELEDDPEWLMLRIETSMHRLQTDIERLSKLVESQGKTTARC